LATTSPVAPTTSTTRRDALLGVGLVLLIAVVGLYIVKWQPYYLRAFAAATNHSIGASIVSGTAAAPPEASLQAAWDYARAYFLAVWQAMVLGLLLAATIESSVPRDLLVRWLGGGSGRSSLLGGVLSLPGMMCTCCTAPVAVGLRRSGAAPGAATAFFLGNPTLNPAVLVFMLFTLGWQWALLRLVLGVVLVFGGAWAAMRWNARLTGPAPAEAQPTPAPTGPWLERWFRALIRLIVQLIPEYIVMVGLLGFARAFLFPTAGPDLGNSVLVMVALAIAGTLFVIPTAGEIPIIQTMLGFGMGAGPAGVLLLTLAPVSLPSLVMVGRALPVRLLVGLGVWTAVLGLVAGGLAIVGGL
jgi:hypothetical protein